MAKTSTKKTGTTKGTNKSGNKVVPSHTKGGTINESKNTGTGPRRPEK